MKPSRAFEIRQAVEIKPTRSTHDLGFVNWRDGKEREQSARDVRAEGVGEQLKKGANHLNPL
jgi:hypothetical protein